MSKSEKIYNCPNCKTVKMKKINCGPELIIDQCPDCLGIWLDNGEYSSLKQLGDFYTFNIDKGMRSNTIINKERICPVCKKELTESKPKDYDLKIDICKKCRGIWLDRGELNKLI